MFIVTIPFSLEASDFTKNVTQVACVYALVMSQWLITSPYKPPFPFYKSCSLLNESICHMPGWIHLSYTVVCPTNQCKGCDQLLTLVIGHWLFFFFVTQLELKVWPTIPCLSSLWIPCKKPDHWLLLTIQVSKYITKPYLLPCSPEPWTCL